MNYSDLQSNFTALLNRRDLTPTLTNLFLQQSFQTIQRTLRIPAMEKSLLATIGSVFTDGLQVPGDLLQLIAITDNDTGLELKRATLPQVLPVQLQDASGLPYMFTRRNATFLIAPLPKSGKVLRMDFYAQFPTLVLPTDTNVLTDIAPDVVLTGALVRACTYFSDKRKDGFKADFELAMLELNMQANADELTANAQVAPAFSFDED